jgi:hypothetical protein
MSEEWGGDSPLLYTMFKQDALTATTGKLLQCLIRRQTGLYAPVERG